MHRDSYVATVPGKGFQDARSFEADREGALALKKWTKGLGYRNVLVESYRRLLASTVLRP